MEKVKTRKPQKSNKTKNNEISEGFIKKKFVCVCVDEN